MKAPVRGGIDGAVLARYAQQLRVGAGQRLRDNRPPCASDSKEHPQGRGPAPRPLRKRFPPLLPSVFARVLARLPTEREITQSPVRLFLSERRDGSFLYL
ncbi:hypothetical protein AAFF_G00040040 [Aldrovandia affinis]|uniref:Uncharacterized protein n=1 Tax=Aldrovandia affinis TaxID=143900 RepID=A0AAD7WFM3_9TELE|nr:hypothetical protein AAFF_G00040040 [Aldrovandia affinis]